MSSENSKKSFRNIKSFFYGVTGVGCFLIFSYVSNTNFFWKGLSTLGIIGTVAGASFVLGFLIGFLFGVPRTVESSDTALNKSSTPTRIQANTNLEQISDWLTKILVGVGLTQIIPILKFFKTKVVDNLAPGFDLLNIQNVSDYKPSYLAISITIAVITYFSVSGFIIGYFYTVLIFSQNLKDNYELEKKLDRIQSIRQIVDVIPDMVALNANFVLNESKNETNKTLDWIISKIDKILSNLREDNDDIPNNSQDLFDKIIKNINNEDYLFFKDFRTKEYIYIGIVFIYKREYPNAIKLFDKALNTNPYSYEAHNLKGLMYHWQNKYDLAIDSFDQAISIDRKNSVAWSNKAVSLVEKTDSHSSDFSPEKKLKLTNDVIEALDQSIALNPFDPSAYITKGYRLSLVREYSNLQGEEKQNSEYEELAAYEQALALDSKYTLGFYNTACWHVEKNNIDLAIKNLKRAIDLNPDIKEMAKKEKDFDSIRQNGEFTKLLI